MTAPADPASERAWFYRGVRDALGFPLVLMMITMLGIGGLTRDIGYPVWAGTLSTALVWAGPAQVIVLGAVASGAALPATAFAVWLSSARFLPMTVSILPLIRGDRLSFGRTILAAHMVAMTSWVEGLRRLPPLPQAARWAYFMGYASVIMAGGVAMTHAGFYAYALVPKAVAAIFLFTTPLFFSSALVASARSGGEWTALAVGALATPFAMHLLPSGVDFLAVGLVGGTLGFMVVRRSRRHAGAGA